MSTSSNYDFAIDPDFVLVESTSKYIKSLRTYTMDATEFRERYGSSGYGTVSQGMQFYMLASDFEYYSTHTITGVAVKLVEPEPQQVEEVIAANMVEFGEDLVTEASDLHEDLTVVKHIGKATAKKLELLGYTDVEALTSISYSDWDEVAAMASTEQYLEMLASAHSVIG